MNLRLEQAVYGLDTFEIDPVDGEALAYARGHAGHYTAKVDPLASKRALHEAGFYYCDTLLEPRCARADLVRWPRPGITVGRDIAFDAADNIYYVSSGQAARWG